MEGRGVTEECVHDYNVKLLIRIGQACCWAD